ncbi:MAG: hypothetical protein A2902_05125 [Elusimicrobia bacterium RIFCSPLOWO2_01_FULL_64_13]|nr:MAG: hypothetical protein A2636_02575 [Elusimicrobia bacterium RIFCSPHIGHO2_01_FULL_64_10]OGR97125.1 MAG: hypothetical protein A2902_05125 [Elusimicrobia bacterium RIFCSPLOWO2_01_FULL_64_13]
MSDPASNPPTDPASKKILVVDDDKNICAFFKTLLEAEGFVVDTLHGGEPALEVLHSRGRLPYDLLILDLMMPKYGGYEVLKEMQKAEYQDVPIFVVTARVLDEDTINLIKSESNVQAFWSKPVDSWLFKNKIHAILRTIPLKNAKKA